MDEVNSLMREALSFLEAGEPGMAEESYAAAVALAAQHLGEGHPVTASLLGHLARSCLEQTGKEAFATSLLERQVYLYEHEPKLQALLEERLGALQELIGAYRSQGNYEAAKALALKAELVSEEVEKRILDMELRVEANEFKAQQKQREEEERLRQQSEAGCDEDDDDDDEDDGDDGSDDAIDRAAATQAQEAKQRGRRDMPPPVPRTHTGASARGKGADEKSASLKRKGRAESSNESSMNAAQRTQHRTRK